MKAALFYQQGGPDVLRVEEVPDPRPEPGWVVLRVLAAALNRLDLKARQDRPEVEPMPHIGGLDVVGEVAAVGDGVSGWQPGDRAVVYPILSCGRCPFCRRGDNALCDQQRVFGFQTQGGFAEYTSVPAVNLVRIPKEADPVPLAAVPTAYLTAWRMLVGRAQLQRNETVLIHSVGGGVGSAALDIARYLGARTIVTAGAPRKLEIARERGADRTVLYTEEDVLGAVAAFTEGRGVDVVIETVGAPTWEISCRSAAKNGRIVTCGVTGGPEAPTNIRYLYQHQLSILGAVMGGPAELRSVLNLVLMGRLRPAVDRVLSLDAVAEAHRILEERIPFGKVVLRVAGEG